MHHCRIILNNTRLLHVLQHELRNIWFVMLLYNIRRVRTFFFCCCWYFHIIGNFSCGKLKIVHEKNKNNNWTISRHMWIWLKTISHIYHYTIIYYHNLEHSWLHMERYFASIRIQYDICNMTNAHYTSA